MSRLSLDPEEFRRLGARAVDTAADYLTKLNELPVMPAVSGEETQARFSGEWPRRGMGAAAFDAIPDLMKYSRAPSPRFYGYVLGSGEPIGAIGDFLASVMNQNVTAWRSGPAAVTVERTVVGWLADAIGCQGFVGSLCGGGSSANLMGLAMAREQNAPANVTGNPAGKVYASDEVHMSIPKAIALLGIGTQNLQLIRTDKLGRMDVAELERAMQRDAAAGHRPIAVVASAGTVNTGAIDPLTEVADVSHRHGAWFHIDGAYGALAAIAAPEKFRGLDRADSLSLDAHKWLYQPMDCGCLLYRDRAAAQRAFSNSGEYTKAFSQDPIEGFAFFEESLELSRRFRALKIWLSLRYHGLDAYRTSIGKDLEFAQALAGRIRSERTLEMLAPVELSALCFRWIGDGKLDAAALDQRNADILKQVQRRGRVYISNARIGGRFALRACLTNHRSTLEDVLMVVDEVLTAAR